MSRSPRTSSPSSASRPSSASSPVPWARFGAVLVVGGLTACALLALAWVAGGPALSRVRGGGPAAPGDALAVVAAGALATAVAWTAAGGALALLAVALRSGGRPWTPLERVSARVVPGVVRRLAAAALGAGVLGGAAAPALALPVPVAVSAPAEAGVTAAAPLPAAGPGWPAEGQPWRAPAPTAVPPAAPSSALGVPAPTRETGPAASDGAEVVVRRGDTLWDLAERSLPAGAGAAEVAEEWPRWWRANVDVVGDDPDLLLPGQVLRAPGDVDRAAPR